MSCRNLEVIITELARGQMLEARVREDVLLHMKDCRRCAARFADEQSLTAGLRAVAASASLAETPARVETALLSAFRQQRENPFRPMVTPALAAKPRWIPLSIAAAAAILIISALAAQFMPSTNSGDAVQNQASINQPAPVQTAAPEESDAIERGKEPGDEASNSDQRLADMQQSPRGMNRRRDIARNASLSSNQSRNVNSLAAAANSNEEIVTDFLPLTYGGSLTQMDDGQVVRVELPRSALQSFGLPVNAERAGERVKADVLLGHDGVARAIRFVR
jgi:hypothetical protein